MWSRAFQMIRCMQHTKGQKAWCMISCWLVQQTRGAPTCSSPSVKGYRDSDASGCSRSRKVWGRLLPALPVQLSLRRGRVLGYSALY